MLGVRGMPHYYSVSGSSSVHWETCSVQVCQYAMTCCKNFVGYTTAVRRKQDACLWQMDRVTHCVMTDVLWMKVGAQCHQYETVKVRWQHYMRCNEKAEESAKFTVWDKVPEGSSLIFGDTQIPLQHNLEVTESSFSTKNQFDPLSYFNTSACDQ